MKLTNKLGLPKPILEAIANDPYTRGKSDISATSLINPVQLEALKERYGDQMEEDAADRIYSLQGQSIHTILERAAESLTKEGYLAEERYYIDIGEWTLSAQVDVFHKPSGLLQDYKVTSVYAVKDGPKEEYVKQLNIGAYLLQHGYRIIDGNRVYDKLEVKQLQIVAILRDWSKGEFQRAERDADDRGFDNRYPEHQVKILDVPLIPSIEVLGYIQDRVQSHKAARALPDSGLPLCSKEERWAKDDVYAVMKKGQKRAVKLHGNERDADLHAEQVGGSVQFRQGESVRCKSYCPAAKFCKQYNGSNS